jgi:hypothetical protein
MQLDVPTMNRKHTPRTETYIYITLSKIFFKTTMDTAADPTSTTNRENNKRVRFSDSNQQPRQAAHTPIGKAIFVASVTLTLLPPSIEPLAEQATRQYLDSNQQPRQAAHTPIGKARFIANVTLALLPPSIKVLVKQATR